MHITGFSIDGFGMLSNLGISQLTPGLNVIHGTNGSGKTTILHFLRGVLCGFQESRRLNLLPPLKGGHPGGSISVDWNDGQYDIIRQIRPDRTDLVAINLRLGAVSEIGRLRGLINGIDRDRLCTLFVVTNLESHALESLFRLAIRDGVHLKSERQSADWLGERIEQVQEERAELFQSEPTSRNRIADLERKKSQLQQDVSKLSRDQQARQERWGAAVHRLKHECERLQREVDWLHTELGANQSDLTEVQTRLWSVRSEVVLEQQVVEQPAPIEGSPWGSEIQHIDAQIAHAQQVLRDLAASRLHISIEKSWLAGTERPDVELHFARHRRSIQDIETEVLRLRDVQGRLQTVRDAGRCLCDELSNSVQAAIDAIRRQLALICQELSRQQADHTQWLLQSQREGVDQCEQELIHQIQRLRLRRDELQHHPKRSPEELLQHRSGPETVHCECREHDAFIRTLPSSAVSPPMVQMVVPQERKVIASEARPDDSERELPLIERGRQLQRQWWEAMTRLKEAQLQLRQLEQEQDTFAQDPALPERRYEYVILEQHLADAREQWQSLTLLQHVLKLTRNALQVERRSPVLEEASRLLSRLTENKYTAFEYDELRGELRLMSEGQRTVPISALSRGTLDQACLSFRLALCAEYARRGIRFPLILDDVLADSDESRLAISAEVLAEYGRAGQQILFMTCQDRLAARFRAMQVPVQFLSGTVPPQFRPVTSAPAPAPAPPSVNRLIDREQSISGPHTLNEDKEVRRVQPAAPFWLEVNSSLAYLPSMSAQMARRLGTLGVRDLGDLIDLNPLETEVPLAGLQVSTTQLHVWQAEARLLCCVPHLNGRDAQLLAVAGYEHPGDVAQADLDHLLNKIARIQIERAHDPEYAWLADRTDELDHEAAARWIHAARRARTLEDARQTAITRSPAGLIGRRRQRRAERRQVMAASRPQHTRTDGLWPAHRPRRSSPVAHTDPPRDTRITAAEQPAHLRYHLEMTSPIVDAPAIGPKTARRLQQIGLHTIAELLQAPAIDVARQIEVRHITENVVRSWQQQATLMYRVPGMRGRDVQLLIGCGVSSPEQLLTFAPQQLLDIVGPYSQSKEGQRLLRSAPPPDLNEVTQWITRAQQARRLRAT